MNLTATHVATAAEGQPSAAAPRRPRVEAYHKTWCPYSRAALALLAEKGVAVEVVDVTRDPGREAEMIRRSGRTSVPEVFVDGALIGGYDELAALDAHGKLDAILNVAGTAEAV